MLELPQTEDPGAHVTVPRRSGATADESARVTWIAREFDERSWRRSAACRDIEPSIFFPVGVTGPAVPQIAEAKAVCRRCPVRMACLQYALVSYQEFGVWGGYDEEERRDLRRRWRRLGRPLHLVADTSPAHVALVDVDEPSNWAPEAS
jgi:WhiB family redox-sensing transcriptional regulator